MYKREPPPMDDQPPPPPSRNRASNQVDLTLGLGLPEQVAPPPPPHSCTYCMKTFSTPQALGGHQNAHREERSRLGNHVINSQEVNQREVVNWFGPAGDLRNGGGRRGYEVGQGSRNNEQEQPDDDSDEKMDLNLKL